MALPAIVLPPMAPVRPEQHESGHAGPSAVPLDFVYYRSREPHPDWVRSLEELSPPEDVTKHGVLKLVWEPGETWNPWQRWMIYEGIDPLLIINGEPAVDPEILAELTGPHPRSEGHMCHSDVPEQFQCLCRRKLGRWKGGPVQLITLRQYQLYRETGLYCIPFWVIQGKLGGHQFNYDNFQRRLMVQEGLEPDPPIIGSLPFAEPDHRVWRQLRRFNRLIAMDKSLSEYRELMGAGYGQYKAEVEKQMRKQFVDFLAEQTREEADLFITGIRKGEADDAPKTDTDWDRVDELSTKDYIETGIMNHTRAYLPR